MILPPTLSDYLTVFRRLPGNFLLVLPDADFTIVDNTDGHAAVSLKTRAEVAGQPLFEAYPPSDEENYQILRGSLTYVRQHQQEHTMPRIRYDLPRSPAQGGGLEERYWQATHYPIMDDEGQLCFIMQQTEDVTAQHVAEQRELQARTELVESQERARFLLEELPVMMWSTSPDGSADYQNPRWLKFTGRQLSDLMGKTWLEDIHPDDRTRAQEAWNQAQATGHSYEVEYRLRRHDGQYRWILSQGVARRNDAGELLAWVGTGLDIHEQKQVHQQLAAKDEQLMQIMSQVPAYIATVTGPDHRFTFATPNYNTLMGGRVQLGQRATDLLPEVAAQGFMDLLDTVYRTKETYIGHETRIEILDPATGDTREHYLNFVYQPLYGTEGQAQGILAFGVDVTQQVLVRQRAEALATEVRRSDERLRRMTEALPNITYINEASGVGHYVSPQWYSYTGLPEGSSIAEHWRETVHPDDLARVENEYTKARQESRGWSFELRFRRHDGQYQWFLNQAQPELDANGHILRWYGSDTDIHAQKELTEALRQSEEYFRFLSESVPQIIWTAEAEGQVDYFNQRLFEVTGLHPADCLGSSAWASILHPDDQQRALTAWQAAHQTGDPYEIEYRFVSRTGGYRWFLGRAEPLRNEVGEIVRWFGSCTDIDEVKQTQQLLHRQNAQLTQINQALDNFVYTASHDLKQPITNMAGIFEELKRTATFHDEAAAQLIGMFEGALHQINTTIQDLSAVVQVQRQHEQLPIEQIELLPFTQEILHSLQDQIDTLHAQVELDFAATPVLPFVRPNLQSILFNLISNALKYAAPARPPLVQVSTQWVEDKLLQLTVQDNGLGIDLERHERQLFQMFRRFHHHVDGSGMGLYLVNRIVQQMGGSLEVESEVDTGTLFRLLLPIQQP
ncbi:PAS domain-containing sensor histidine kinase [Hymenobacter wooponensis]|uniref:histidine kinase n=1 Tax=Hymenobacter wooponensis TaxID=1525360 RepID=A0A4Z0MG01_9BACT|nr:PAS domain-containing sensor histidine kinase [Hymenobacter wooponensis]TGD78451.1 PAS domain-containing sensor histidine kinase [Hymenobacter wooponensis]